MSNLVKIILDIRSTQIGQLDYCVKLQYNDNDGPICTRTDQPYVKCNNCPIYFEDTSIGINWLDVI